MAAAKSTLMRPRDVWAFRLAGLDVIAVLLWLPLLISESFVLGPWFLLPNAVFVFLGCLGIWMFVRADSRQRLRRPMLILKWTSLFIILVTISFAWFAHSFHSALNDF